MIYLRWVLIFHHVNRSISTSFSLFHLVLYKRFNYLTMRLRFWWFSARNGTTIISNHVLFIFLLNNFFENLLMNSFVYFLLLYCYWSVLCQDGGTSVDIQSRLNEARNAFMSLRSVWGSASYSTKTKLRVYQSCVNSPLRLGMLANDRTGPLKTGILPHS